MGLREAQEYITKLHKLQDNPYNWPDYLTGLPDRAAVLKKIDEVYDKLDRYSVAYVRIVNVHPYLLKYGDSKHAEIIQWAAALLKTTATSFKGAFVGAVGTHEFAVVAKAKDMKAFLSKSKKLFVKKTRGFYTDSDIQRDYVFSFSRDGEKVLVGFMDLVHVTLEEPRVERYNVIPYLAQLCGEVEEQA
jgi:GGDEF domain-containing protein